MSLIFPPMHVVDAGSRLGRVLGMVVWGLGESFAKPWSLPATMAFFCVIHLEASSKAHYLLLWRLKCCLVAGASSSFPGQQCWCGGGVLVWTCLVCKTPSTWHKLSSLVWLAFGVVFCCFVLVLSWHPSRCKCVVTPSRLMALLI